MKENRVSQSIVDAAMAVHRTLGPGLLESVYEEVLAYELGARRHRVERQRCCDVRYGELVLRRAFRVDLLVDDLVMVEVKSAERDHPAHKKQLLTYLRLANKRLGLLLNFGHELMKTGICRVVNGLPDEPEPQRGFAETRSDAGDSSASRPSAPYTSR